MLPPAASRSYFLLTRRDHARLVGAPMSTRPSRRTMLTLANLMIAGFPNAIYNRPGKDQEIEHVIQSIKAAGRVGLPVVEYNWYAHRAMEGYFEEVGRAGAGWTGFDYARMKDLPPLPE